MKANKALNGRLHFHGFRRRPPPPVLPAIGAAVLASNGGGDFIAAGTGGAHLAVQGLPGHGRDGRCRPMKYQAGILHGYFQNIAADFRPESLSAYLENPAKTCL